MELKLKMRRLSRLDKFPFHMPGHKNKFPQLLEDYDPTELPGMDNLHHPQAVLKRTQRRVADIYNVAQTYFLVNGSSVGLMAAITSVVGPGDYILVQRTCHKAVLAGIIHSGAMPVWIEQEFCPQDNRWLPPSAEKVSDLLAAHRFKAAVFTNPDYFGFGSDIRGVVELCHQAGVLVIADEAHGAHLIFGRQLNLPLSAVDAQCDIIVQSPHKTLPALTQAAWMHLNNPGLSTVLQQNLNLFHTTSPSYLLLSSLEYAGTFAQARATRLLKHLAGFIKMLELRSRQLDLSAWTTRSSRDWTKFTLPYRLGMESVLLAAGIYPELIQGDKVLFFVTLADALEPAGLCKLYDLLPKLSLLTEAPRQRVAYPPVPRQECPPREAWAQRGKQVPIPHALGRIARQVIAPYPPGTIVVAPGQRLDSEHIQYLTELLAGKVISKWIEVI